MKGVIHRDPIPANIKAPLSADGIPDGRQFLPRQTPAACIASRSRPPKLSQSSYPNGVESRSPGLAALFAAYPGDSMHSEATLKGLHNHRIRTQPFQGRFYCCSFPRVGCKKRSQPWALRNYPFGVVLRQPRRTGTTSPSLQGRLYGGS
jgi:hypothetical protein